MKCRLERIIYPKRGVSNSSGYTVAEYKAKEDNPELGVNKDDVFTATGTFLSSALIDYELKGEWVMNQKYGKQLKITEISELTPKTVGGIVSFLSSGLIKGVGEKMALKIALEFKEDTLNVIETSPERLIEVKGVTAKKAQSIHDSYIEHKSTYSLVSFLSPLGVSSKKAMRIFKKFKDKALEIVKNHPFSLCDIRGFGFNTVCEIAERTGASRGSDEACEAALIYALKMNETKGDLYMPIQPWVNAAYGYLDCSEVTGNQLLSCAKRLMQKKKVKMTIIPGTNEKVVYLRAAVMAEHKIAQGVAKMLNKPLGNDYDIAEAISTYEEQKHFMLAPEQISAVQTSLGNRISIITGGPGTGKTTIVDCIYSCYQKQYPDKTILMCAPTGCAARRISESTGISAFTLHKVLGLAPNDEDDDSAMESSCILDVDLLIVDEFSMVDVYLASALMESLHPRTQLVIIGDVDQLPSVGPGSVLSEMIDSGMVPVSRLKKIYRQKNGSKVALNASKIKNGDENLEFDSRSFIFYEVSGVEDAYNKVNELFIQTSRIEDVGEVTILSPFKRKTLVCSNEFNKAVHDKVNPPDKYKREHTYNGLIFRVGDKVLQNKNCDGISNGDIGFISRIEKTGEVFVTFGNKEVQIKDMDIIEHAYSMSVHKSQGSEYKTVIIDVLDVHKPMLWRNLLYTGVTRAKDKVIIVGQRSALLSAIRNGNAQKRNTLLAKRIIAEVSAA